MRFESHPRLPTIRYRLEGTRIRLIEFLIEDEWVPLKKVAEDLGLAPKELARRVRRAKKGRDSIQWVLREIGQEEIPPHREALAPGICQVVLGKFKRKEVRYQDRWWSAPEISEKVGISESSINRRITQAISQGLPVSWIFRPRVEGKGKQPESPQEPPGEAIPAKGCHYISPLVRMALCAPWTVPIKERKG